MKLSLFREYLRFVINEHGSLGTTIASDERGAKRAYEAAIHALMRHDVESKKKHAFIELSKKLGVAPDSAAAKRLKHAEPEKYAYDPKVLQSSYSTLFATLEKAKKRLEMFDPTAVDPETLSTRERHNNRVGGIDVKMPERRKKAYINVDELEPMTLYKWDDKRWADDVKPVPLGFGKEEGSHPGEDRLAFILGGQVQGDNVSFDIVTSNGWRWEVKGLRKSSDEIRPGVHGMRAFDVAEKVLSNVCQALREFVEEMHAVGVNEITTTVEQRGMFAVIARFVEDEADDVEAGEVSYERFILFRRALKAASALKSAWTIELGQLSDRSMNIVGKDVSLSWEKYVGIARQVHKAKPDSEVLNVVDSRERVLQLLWNEAFDDPDSWMDQWDESIDVNKIFADVSGVFIVTPHGFYKVPRKMFRTAFKLKRISKGTPRYAVEM